MNDWPIITQNCIDNVESVLRTGVLTSKNKAYNELFSYQSRFTCEFCKFLNISYGRIVPNGTIAIVIALLSAGIKQNDYVLVSENTWIASIGAITLINAIPILVPCNKDSLLIDCNQLLKLSKKYKPKACVIVHLNGIMQDYSKTFEELHKNHVMIIEDCAQAIGSEYCNHKAGPLGDIGVFSFQESKFLTCGEGGFVCTNDIKLYRKISLYQDLTYIQKVPMKKNEMYLFGSNYRVTESTCALLYSQYNNIFIKMINEKDFLAKKMLNMLYTKKRVRSVVIDKNQNVLSLFKLPILFENFEEKEKFKLFLKRNNLNFYDGTKPLYLTNLFSEGTKKLKKMKYQKKIFDDYSIQINQIGIYHYNFTQQVYNLLNQYFKDF